jgi:Ubiquitin-protein ligase
VAAAAAAGAARGGGPSLGAAASSECRKAIRAELLKLHREPHAACDVYPSEQDMAFWKVVLEGPDGSSYVGGTFLLSCSFPPSYPVQVMSHHVGR